MFWRSKRVYSGEGIDPSVQLSKYALIRCMSILLESKSCWESISNCGTLEKGSKGVEGFHYALYGAIDSRSRTS